MFQIYKRGLHKIANTTIKVNNRDVATFKVTFYNNNNLNFRIKNTTSGQLDQININLHDYILSTIDDDNIKLNHIDLKVVIEQNDQDDQDEDSFDVPLKQHFLEKYSQRNKIKKSNVKVENPRDYIF